MKTYECPTCGGEVPGDNMTLRDYLRDYFASEAPEAIPLWFKPNLEPVPPYPHDASFCEGCRDGADCHETEACQKAHKWNGELHQIKKRNEQAIYFQWRWAYAAAMLAEREKAT